MVVSREQDQGGNLDLALTPSEGPVVSFLLWEKCPFKAREVPFPKLPHSEIDRWGRGEIEENWKEAGRFFISEYDRSKNRVRLMRIDWGQDTFELTLREVGDIIRRAKTTVGRARSTLYLGELIDEKSGIWGFSQPELLQLMIGTYAFKLALAKGELIPSELKTEAGGEDPVLAAKIQALALHFEARRPKR